jgi:diguanylate cyclase (GGDEF)-like protein/PAS domain S-box-containing protein
MLIYLLDLTAVIYVSGILIHEKFLSIDFARQEIAGAQYTDVVRASLMAAFLPGSPEDVADSGRRLAVVRHASDEHLHTTEAAERFASALQPASPSAGPQQDRLLDQGRHLLTVVGNQSNLILDPDLDSYYVMSLTVLRFPELLRVLHDIRKFLDKGGPPRRSDHGRLAQLLALSGRVEAVRQGVESDYAQAWQAGSPALRGALQPARMALLAAVDSHLEQVRHLAAEGGDSQASGQLDAAHLQALQALDEAWRDGVAQLDLLLRQRVKQLFARMWLHLGTALLLLASILSLVYLVASQIARPLQGLAAVADRVRRSADYSQRAHWHSRDEIGQLFAAFNGMLAQLDRERLNQQELAASARAAQAQRELVEAFPIAMVVTSVPDHEVLHANTPAMPWLGECRADPWRAGLEPGVRSRFFQRLADKDVVEEFEVRWLAGTEPSWAVLSARRLNYQGREAVLTAFTPINVIKVMEQRLELWAKVFEASSESIVIMNAQRQIVSVNKAFCRSTQYDFYDVVGEELGLLLEAGSGPDWPSLADKDAWQGEVHIRRQSGETYPAWLMVSAVRDRAAQGVVNYIGISIDITDRKAKEDRIRFLAQHDVLTELPNRSLCQQRLAQALEAARLTGEQLAVLFIDLDRFKLINDTLGHHVGDGLLRTVAQRLSQAVRAEDTVARLGGDEFVIVMRHVRDRGELEALVDQRLIASIRQPMVVEGHEFSVSCSVGVALFPADASEQEDLVRRADAAMYEAKSGGRDKACFFTEATDQRVLARQHMEAQLRQAQAHGELSLYYQPRLWARSRRVAGAEALLRWHSPVLGPVSPGEFIGLAEETGLIKSMGLWVLRTACEQWAAWRVSGQVPEGAVLSVNLSAVQLADEQLLSQITEVLSQTGLPPDRLELELTESHLMDNPELAQARVAALSDLGVAIAIDDFGTGYSSLAYLKRFDIDKLKVDQSFVRGMLEDGADAAIVQAVIALGHTLGLTVVAEGVENLPTAQTLTALGCDELQGYAFARPLPADAFATWLTDRAMPVERRGGRWRAPPPEAAS